jgi:hypothetical protein
VCEQRGHGFRVIVVRRQDQQRVALVVGEVRGQAGAEQLAQLGGRTASRQVEHPVCERDRPGVQFLCHGAEPTHGVR